MQLIKIRRKVLFCLMKRNNKERGGGLNDEYVEGIFVSGEMQSQGIGKILLNYAKDKRNKLHLNGTHGQYLFIREKDLRFSIVA